MGHARYRYGKDRRLLRSSQFKYVLAARTRIFTRRFILYVRAGSAGENRLGITVSKRVGNAVTRNRIKRCVREAFRNHPEWFNESTDLVVIVKSPKRGQRPDPRARRLFGTHDVASELGRALRRLNEKR